MTTFLLQSNDQTKIIRIRIEKGTVVSPSHSLYGKSETILQFYYNRTHNNTYTKTYNIVISNFILLLRFETGEVHFVHNDIFCWSQPPILMDFITTERNYTSPNNLSESQTKPKWQRFYYSLTIKQKLSGSESKKAQLYRLHTAFMANQKQYYNFTTIEHTTIPIPKLTTLSFQILYYYYVLKQEKYVLYTIIFFVEVAHLYLWTSSQQREIIRPQTIYQKSQTKPKWQRFYYSLTIKQNYQD